MGSLYVGVYYGYNFIGEDEQIDFVPYEDNMYDAEEKAKICVDQNGNLKFMKRVLDDSICLFGYSTFDIGEQLNISDSEIDSINKDFEKMLIDEDTPELMKERDNWELAGIVFNVTT